MDSQAAVSAGALPEETPLVGEHGQEYIQSLLSTTDPVTAITEIQQKGGIQDSRCTPLLGLLDQLGLSRAESHHYIVKSATNDLLERIADMNPDQRLQLLEVCVLFFTDQKNSTVFLTMVVLPLQMTFPFIGISALRAIPLALLERIHPVPATFIKQLAVDRELFWQLPGSVQRQAWELDRKLLQIHALPLINAYTYEVATSLRGLDMDEGLPVVLPQAGSQEGGINATSQQQQQTPPQLPRLPRRVLRSGSAALQRLVHMVGSSVTVYRGIIDVCVAVFRDHHEAGQAAGGMREAALCSLRSQLLMALHDVGESRLCTAEPSHKLACTLDACLKDGAVDERRSRELLNFFHAYDISDTHARHRHAIAALRTGRPSSGSARNRTTGATGHHRRRTVDDDAESAGAPGASRADDPLKELGQAAMILRDPPAYHLLLHHVIRRIEKAVDAQTVPSEDKELVFVTRLLQLGAGAGAMIRDRKYQFPEPAAELVTTLYPIIADLVLEAQLRDIDDDEQQQEEDPEANAALLQVMLESEVARRVVEVYCLERLAAGDVVSARIILRAIASCCDVLTPKSIPEFGPFGLTLARRIATMLSTNSTTPEETDQLWFLAVDRLLVRLVDAETDVHEEVLRLLLAAAVDIDLIRLANYVTMTLNNSRRSRKRHKKRALEEREMASPPGGGGGGNMTELLGGGNASSYWTGTVGGGGGIHNNNNATTTGLLNPLIGGSSLSRGADGVRATYQRFLQVQPALTAAVAPTLHSYLDQSLA